MTRSSSYCRYHVGSVAVSETGLFGHAVMMQTRSGLRERKGGDVIDMSLSNGAAELSLGYEERRGSRI